MASCMFFKYESNRDASKTELYVNTAATQQVNMEKYAVMCSQYIKISHIL